jgi:hypothetical protein
MSLLYPQFSTKWQFTLPVTLAVYRHKETTSPSLCRYNKHMTRLNEDGVLYDLEYKYFVHAANSTAPTCAPGRTNLVVNLSLMGGVWIVLAVGLLVGIALILLPRLNAKLDVDRHQVGSGIKSLSVRSRPAFSNHISDARINLSSISEGRSLIVPSFSGLASGAVCSLVAVCRKGADYIAFWF